MKIAAQSYNRGESENRDSYNRGYETPRDSSNYNQSNFEHPGAAGAAAGAAYGNRSSENLENER